MAAAVAAVVWWLDRQGEWHIWRRDSYGNRTMTNTMSGKTIPGNEICISGHKAALVTAVCVGAAWRHR